MRASGTTRAPRATGWADPRADGANRIEIADAEGLDAVSMGLLATEVGTATMSVYRYVTGKDELIVRMAATVLAEQVLPADPPADWRAQLELSARSR